MHYNTKPLVFFARQSIDDALVFRRDQGEEGVQMVNKLRRVLLAYRLLPIIFVTIAS